jgi:hypothetical protein
MFIEEGVFIDSSTPNAEHVEVRFLSLFNELLIFFFSDPRNKGICGNPVGPLAKDWLSVNGKDEGLTFVIGEGFLSEGNFAKAPDFFKAIEFSVVFIKEEQEDFVEVRFTETVWPPEAGWGNLESYSEIREARISPERFIPGGHKLLSLFLEKKHSEPKFWLTGKFPGEVLHHSGEGKCSRFPALGDLSLYKNLPESKSLEKAERNAPPDTHIHQTRCPIPGKGELGFSHPDSSVVLFGTSRRIRNKGLLFDSWNTGVNPNHKDIFTLEFSRNIDDERNKHVLVMGEVFPIEVDIAIGINAFEDEFSMEREQLFGDREFSAVPPFPFFNPLAKFSIFAKKRFGNFSCPEKVKVHLPRDQGF